jgi:hypothetical protein
MEDKKPDVRNKRMEFTTLHLLANAHAEDVMQEIWARL